jgi:hypothetical protein
MDGVKCVLLLTKERTIFKRELAELYKTKPASRFIIFYFVETYLTVKSAPFVAIFETEAN